MGINIIPATSHDASLLSRSERSTRISMTGNVCQALPVRGGRASCTRALAPTRRMPDPARRSRRRRRLCRSRTPIATPPPSHPAMPPRGLPPRQTTSEPKARQKMLETSGMRHSTQETRVGRCVEGHVEHLLPGPTRAISVVVMRSDAGRTGLSSFPSRALVAKGEGDSASAMALDQ